MDAARADGVDAELDRLIERRARKGEVNPDEREPLWQESVRRYTARRREENRLAWCEHHEGQAVRLRAVLEGLIADHEEQAERYRDQPKEQRNGQGEIRQRIQGAGGHAPAHENP